MNRRKLSIFVAVVMLIGVFTIPVTPIRAATTTVKIGLLAPKTGALGSLGPTFENAANLAIKDLNAMGSNYTFELVVEDTETSSTKAEAAAQTLVDAGVVGIVGAAASSSTLAAIGKAKAAKIPLVSYASTSPAISSEDDDDFLFRVVPSDAFQGKADAQIADFLGVKKVAVIGIDDPYGQGLVGAFKEAFTGMGSDYSVVADISYDQEKTTDFSSQITQIKDSGAEAVFMVSFIDDGAGILNELATQKFEGYILGTDGIASPSLLAISGLNKTANGIMGTAPTITGTSDFNSAYKAEYGTDPTIFVAETYDATMLIGKAVIKADSTDGSDVRDALRVVGNGYEGASGTITFDANGDREGGKYDIWQFQSAGDDGLSLVTVGSWEDNTLSMGTNVITTITSRESPAPISSSSIFFGIMSVAVIAYMRKRKY